MTQVTLDQLKDLLRATAGEDESISLDGDVSGTKFSELGYDSLALLETAAQIKREYGVEITDNEIGEIETPGDLLARINTKLAA